MIRKNLYFLTFGDIPYDQRMQRIWLTLSNAGFEISIFARNVTKLPVDSFPYKIVRYDPIFKQGFLSYAEYNLRALYYLLTRKVQYLCCVDLDTLPAGVVKKMFGKIHLVYDAHEYFTESPEIVQRPGLKKCWEKIADFTIPRVDTAYTVSQSIASELTNRYHVKFGLIRNLPMTIKSEVVFVKKEQYILYQGALNLGRGLEQLILSMVNIRGLKLYLAGDGDLREKLKNIVVENSLSDKVIFLGNLSPDLLKDYTVKAWLGVNLLENLGKSYYFSLANKFFDYIQSGIPQICIDFPEYRSLNNNHNVSILISDISPENIAKTINDLMENPNHYKTMAENASTAAGILNWEKESENLINIYQSITS